jgi:hypothetical protein
MPSAVLFALWALCIVLLLMSLCAGLLLGLHLLGLF